MTTITRSIPLVDLRAQYRTIREEVLSEVEQTFEGMQLILGPKLSAFETAFASFCGARHAIGVKNGTDALHVAIRACGIGPGDEVITVGNTFVATAVAVELAGATPVLVDPDPSIGNLDPSKVEAAITPRTRALLPVHLYGHPADMDPLVDIAQRHHLRVIEDACQAHGAEYRGRRAGTLGDIACFSFYPGKNLGAYGEGGAVVTDDDELAERMRLIRNVGSREKYHHTTFGFNARLDELQAAILQVKLGHLDDWNERRRALAEQYTAELRDLPLETPIVADWATPVFHLYQVRTNRRDALLEWLKERGIGAQIHYPIPIHLQEGFRHLAPKDWDLPVAERWARETVSLPIYPELSADDQAYVIAAVRAFF
jgi:dTDP-4-amino-4,6-dideoxygalactose transaminase